MKTITMYILTQSSRVAKKQRMAYLGEFPQPPKKPLLLRVSASLR
jgi:hypothetical protein